MKVYVTKYALTSGIQICEFEREDEDGCASVKWPGGFNGRALFWRTDWHKDCASAIARAEAMRTAKLASIAKQKAKLEAMTFTIPEA